MSSFAYPDLASVIPAQDMPVDVVMPPPATAPQEYLSELGKMLQDHQQQQGQQRAPQGGGSSNPYSANNTQNPYYVEQAEQSGGGGGGKGGGLAQMALKALPALL